MATELEIVVVCSFRDQKLLENLGLMPIHETPVLWLVCGCGVVRRPSLLAAELKERFLNTDLADPHLATLTMVGDTGAVEEVVRHGDR